MLKQRKQAANLAVQKEQEEQAVQSFTPNRNFSMINDDEEYFIQYKEYLENSSNAITPVLPTEEPKYSLSMGYEHLSTIPKTKSDKVIESSVKNLLPIPREYEVTSDNESECDVPVKDISSPSFTTFSNLLFDCNDDFTSSDDESLSNEDVNLCLQPINSFPRPLENFHANTINETLPSSPILVEGSNSLREEINILPAQMICYFQALRATIMTRKGISIFLKNFLSTIPFSIPKMSHLTLIIMMIPVMDNIDELNEDECFDPGGEINVFKNVEDDDYFPFIFMIRIFLPYLIYPEVSPLLLSAGSEDAIFDPGISV
nr:hypothetical protein [Tanacetum cinerariifolium]